VITPSQLQLNTFVLIPKNVRLYFFFSLIALIVLKIYSKKLLKGIEDIVNNPEVI
jgi:hypothetical protein